VETFRLFFSNRSADAEQVKALQTALARHLPTLPFNDVSLNVPYRDDWKRLALAALESCEAVVCVIGANTHTSEPVDWEVREAHRLGRPLAIIRLSEEYQAPKFCAELKLPILEWNVEQLALQIKQLGVACALFPRHDWKAGAPTPDNLWNQYSVMVQSWEALISRRQTVNTLYVTADAALLAGIGAVASSTSETGAIGAALAVTVLALLGLALSFNWRRTVISYGTLSNAKAAVITTLEAYMPARLFDAEWRVLERTGYQSTTKADTQTAQFFMILFTALAIAGVAVAIAQPLLVGEPNLNV
jgi:hypothetical protein